MAYDEELAGRTRELLAMEMRGRQMRGWLRVGSDDVRTKRELAECVRLGAAYARTPTPKG